jgi:hypothetical protein
MIESGGQAFANVDDRVIRLLVAGWTFSQIATDMGWYDATSAKRRYWAARGRQVIPECLTRTHPKPELGVIAWAAGFFDGEGCVSGYEGLYHGYRRWQFALIVAQVVPGPLDELQRVWGGSISAKVPSNPRHSPQWRWLISGREAAEFLEDVLPYLRVKRKAAEAAMPVMFRTHSHGIPYSDAEVMTRREAVVTLQRLNRGKGRIGRGVV